MWPAAQGDHSFQRLSLFQEQMKTKEHKEIIRASEIGTYLFCNRAWWLKRIEGRESQNTLEMSRGTTRHESHSRTVRSATFLQRAGYFLIGAAMLLILIYFIFQLSL